MRIYRLSKLVWRIQNNAAAFLNGITSNTLDQPHNAFLDIHGKIVATFDQVKREDDEYLIVLERRYEEVAFKHIERFVRLSKVAVTREDYMVYFDCDSNGRVEKQDLTIPQKAGRLLLTKRDLESNIGDDEFTLFRLQNKIPWPGIDFTDEMVLNVSETDYVSFTKGCFLGQEFVAKVHNRSKPTWRLIVKYEDDVSLETRQEMTSKTIDPKTNRVFGFAFVKNN